MPGRQTPKFRLVLADRRGRLLDVYKRQVLTLPTGEELLVSGMGDGIEGRLPAGTQVHIGWDPACAVIVERGWPDEAE